MSNFATTIPGTHRDRAISGTADDLASSGQFVFSTSAFGMHNAVWMLMLSALAARFAAIMLRGEFQPGAAAEFGSIAAGLLEGSGFAFNEAAIYTQHGVYEPSTAQPPTYPLLLAGIYWLLGVKTTAAHVVAMMINAALGAASVPVAYTAARRIGAGHGVALCSAALLAFWPTQIFAATQVHPLPLITFLVTLSVALFNRGIDLQRMGWWIWFCMVAALAALTEPILLPALPVGVVLVLCSRNLPGSLRAAYVIVLLACSAAVIGPWAFRNWRVQGTFQPVTGSFWSGAWKGNNPFSAGTDRPVLTDEQRQRYWSQGVDRLRQFDLLSDAQRQALDGKRSAERESIWRDWTLTYIRDNPGRYLQLCGSRLARTAWADWDDPRSRDPYYIYFTTRSLLLLALLAGLPLAIMQSWRVGWPLALGGAIVVTCTLTVTGARYAMPLEPMLLALLSLLLITSWQRATGNQVRPPIVRRFARGANDGASPASLGLQDEQMPTATLVVIVNYRTGPLVIDCLRSLAPEVEATSAQYGPVRVVITDNGSSDDSPAQIEKAIADNGWSDWAKVQPLGNNGGFAWGNNAAIRPALTAPNPPHYLWLLNPDTIVREGALAALLEFMQANSQAGIAGSRLEDPDGTPQRSAFRFPSVGGEIDNGLRLGLASRILSSHVIAPEPPADLCQAEWLSGASLLIRRAVFEAIGLLDERFFMYFEETDFCRRAGDAGWTCWYIPQSRVVHLVGQAGAVTPQQPTRRRPDYWFESRRRYFLKHLGRTRTLLADALFMVGFVTWRARRRLQRKPDSDPAHFLRDFARNSVWRRGFRMG